MRGSHHNPSIAAVILDLAPHARLAFVIHGRQRLIKQPKQSRHHEQARKRQPPTLTMRKKLRRQVAQLTEAKGGERLFDIGRTAVVTAIEPQIFEQRKLLLYPVLMTEPSYLPNAFFPIGNDSLRMHAKAYASVRDLQKPGDGTQQRSLSCTVRAMHEVDFARRNRKADSGSEQTPAPDEWQVVYDEGRYRRHRSVHMLPTID